MFKKQPHNWFHCFVQGAFSLFISGVISFISCIFARFFLLSTYGTPEISQQYHADIGKMYLYGCLFDLRVVCIIFGPCLIIMSLLALSKRGCSLWHRCYPTIATLLSFLVIWLNFINIYYYKTYQRAIDVFIFGLFDDDTRAIVKTIWHDYPVIPILLIAILGLFVLYRFYSWLQLWVIKKIKPNWHVFTNTVITIVIFVIVAIGCRGSISTFPLRQADSQISELKFLNMLTPNGVMALEWAYKDYKRSKQFNKVSSTEGAHLFSQFFNKPLSADLNILVTKTTRQSFLEDHPPHVILSVMESLGEHLLSMDSSQRDLLGELRPHWQQDWVFKRFISEGDGTIDSLTRLIIRSPNSNISQSIAQGYTFASNLFQPFKNKGYKIIFVYAGNGAWRNLGKFLYEQGVDEFVEQNTLQKLYPDAKPNAWGVPDEYMFRYMEERLTDANKKGEHLFIMTMSMTNHPPYEAPSSYQKTNISLTEQEKTRLSHLAKDKELTEIFHTFRYSNNALGNFISWVKAQPFSNKTIIAATGDHNIRGIGYPSTTELVLGHAVPFYLYVPKEYRGQSSYDPQRVGSHKDIIPTLYQLSLSDQAYYQTGCDILAPALNKDWCFGYNPEVILSKEGAYSLLNSEFYPWLDTTSLLLAKAQPMSEDQKQFFYQKKITGNLLEWLTLWQIQKQPVSRNSK